METGDGLYEDENESGRYVYRGSNPNNYIEFNGELWRIIAKEKDGTYKNGELWRIIAKEKDGTYKILRNEVLSEGMPFDSAGARTTGYCSKGSAPTSGCNAWAANVNLVGSPSEFTNGTITGTVDADSEMLAYLNGEYLKSITINKDKIVSHDYNIGGVSYGNDDLATQIEGEKAYRWNGNVALINVSDYINANSNQELCGTHKNYNGNYATCNLSNYLFDNKTWWLLNPIYSNNRFNFALYEIGNIAQPQSKDVRFVRPAVYLTSNLSLSGSGTKSDPYVIVS